MTRCRRIHFAPAGTGWDQHAPVPTVGRSWLARYLRHLRRTGSRVKRFPKTGLSYVSVAEIRIGISGVRFEVNGYYFHITTRFEVNRTAP